MIRTRQQLRDWLAFASSWVDANPGNTRGPCANTPRITAADTNQVIAFGTQTAMNLSTFNRMCNAIRGGTTGRRRRIFRQLDEERESVNDTRLANRQERARRRMRRFLRAERAAGRRATRRQIEDEVIAQGDVDQAELDATLVSQYDAAAALGILSAR